MSNAAYEKKENWLFWGVFVLYTGIFTFILVTRMFVISFLIPELSPVDLPRQYNLIPFHTLQEIKVLSSYFLGNLLMMVPMGVYFGHFFHGKPWTGILACILTPAAIEGLQFALATGRADIDDYLLNLCGELVGIFLYWILFRIFRRDTGKVKTFLTTTALIFPPFLLSYFRYLFVNLDELHFAWIDAVILLVYFGALFLLMKGAARWQYIYVICTATVFGIFFYTGFIAYVH